MGEKQALDRQQWKFENICIQGDWGTFTLCFEQQAPDFNLGCLLGCTWQLIEIEGTGSPPEHLFFAGHCVQILHQIKISSRTPFVKYQWWKKLWNSRETRMLLIIRQREGRKATSIYPAPILYQVLMSIVHFICTIASKADFISPFCKHIFPIRSGTRTQV